MVINIYNYRTIVKGLTIGVMAFLFFISCAERIWDNPNDQGSKNYYDGGQNNIILQYGSMTDIEGNTYKTIKIGSQTWMAENLKTTKYNDGTSIPNVTDNSVWAGLTSGAYCWYNNDINNRNTYGALYNWHVVNTGKLCPTGWHVPADGEWNTLTNFLGGASISGGKLKYVTGWSSPNTGATNSSGFSALPGGARDSNNGSFLNVGSYGYWWSSSEYDSSNAWNRYLHYDYASLYRYGNYKRGGFSVRCVRDN